LDSSTELWIKILSVAQHKTNQQVKRVVFELNKYGAVYTAGSLPQMDCPSFVGPTVVSETQVEFYCDVNTKETDPSARFEVTFLFDCERDADVPVVTVSTSNLRATLHERYLGRRLHKTVQ